MINNDSDCNFCDKMKSYLGSKTVEGYIEFTRCIPKCDVEPDIEVVKITHF